MGRIVRLLLCMFLLASCSAGDSPGPQRARQAAEVSGSVVMVPGPRAGYVLAPSGTGYTLSDKSGKEAPRTIDRATRLRFTDISVAFDAEGVPGQAYRLYQAAFNRIPDAGGLGYWMRVLDQGAQLPDVASAFVDSAEFKSLYGNAPANADIVGKYYLNVLHRTGEAAGVAYWLDILDSKRATPAQVLAYFSESAENKAAVEVALQALTFSKRSPCRSAARSTRPHPPRHRRPLCGWFPPPARERWGVPFPCRPAALAMP
jgi:hypothetical protein